MPVAIADNSLFVKSLFIIINYYGERDHISDILIYQL